MTHADSCNARLIQIAYLVRSPRAAMMLLETDAILEPEAENPPETVIALAPTATISPFPAFSQTQPRAPDGHTELGPATAYAPSPGEGRGGMGGMLGLVRDCADVVGFDVAAPLPCFPCDSITAVIPSSSGVSRIVPVAPTPCATPLESMTIMTRVGSLQPSPVALLALHLAA